MRLQVECPLCGNTFTAEYGGDIGCNDCGERFPAAAHAVGLR